MKYILFAALLCAINSYADYCSGCNQNYDFVGVVEIIGINEQYRDAFDAKVETIQSYQSRYEVQEAPKTIIILSNLFSPKPVPIEDESENILKEVESEQVERKFESVRTSRGYARATPGGVKFGVGSRIHLFGDEIAENVYVSPSCSCSLLLD